MNRIVWLASYPKSGNTWFRMFLANYLMNGPEPVSINANGTGPMACAREPFDEALGYDSGELTFEEIDRLRPEVYCHLAREAQETRYCKIHDAYSLLPDGRPMFPPEAGACALYFVRNPLDVCVSYAHHSGHNNFDRVIRQMANPQMTFCGVGQSEQIQLRQRLLTWSEHVKSWVDSPLIRVHVLRFEDMRRRPQETFGAAVNYLGLPGDPERLRRAVEFSRFEELKRQEEESGFGERHQLSKVFFRKGEIGSWREALTPQQVARIVADHGETMRRFGYLDARGEVVA